MKTTGLLRLLPLTAFVVLIGPVAVGLAGVLLPAFGFLPALGGASLSLEPWRQLVAVPGLLRSCLLSLGTGLATTLISLLIVLAFIASWRDTRVFAWIERLVSPLLSVPHAAAAFGLALLIAPSGFLFRLISPWLTGWERPPDWLIVHDTLGLTMMAGLVAKEIPFLLLITLAALPQTRAADMTRMTMTLGYGRIASFVHGVLPALYRQIRLPIFAVIAYATSVVDVALILGPTTPSPLAVRLLVWQSDPDLEMRFVAAASAVLQLIVTLTALALWLVGERVAQILYRRYLLDGRRYQREHLARWSSAVAMFGAAMIVIAGIALLGLWSVAGFWRFPDALPIALTISTWMTVLPGLIYPFCITVIIALTTSVLALALALGALEYEARFGLTPSARAMLALYLPLLVPQIAFLFGFEVFLARFRLDGTLGAVIFAHLVFVFPYVLLSLADPWRSWDERYGHMARSLGHRPNAVFWRVRMPMLLRAVLTAGAVGFAVSVGQYLPTLMIGSGRWPTLTTEAVALASGGDRRVIGVTALLQGVLPFVGFALAIFVPSALFRNRRALRT